MRERPRVDEVPLDVAGRAGPAPARSAGSRARALRRVAAALLGLAALSMLLPKLLLVDHSRHVSLHLSPSGLASVLAQDAIVALAAFLALRALLRSPSVRAFAVSAAASTALLVFLLLDARVREVFLRPTDAALVAYGWANRSDLGSGLDLFFNHAAGWGMTFRRCLALVVGSHLVLWCALAAVGLRAAGSAAAPRPAGRLRRAAVAAFLLAAAVVASSAGGEHRYRIDENVLVSAVVSTVRSLRVTRASVLAEVSFDQAPRPLRSAVAGPRLILRGAAPFENLVIVLLESVRWLEVSPTSDASPYPNLRRLAREGLLARCYAPVPHSAKGYYAVLTGRYPYPGMEMREAMALSRPSIVRGLRDRLGATTHAFTSMHFAFENTGGLLRALGVDQLHELADPDGAQEGASSFGGGDGLLYERAVDHLASSGGRFVAVVMPLAAHYPYAYSGKPAAEGPTHAAYLQTLASTDRALGALVRGFEERGLAGGTLFVFVGDHGESFGEHGALVHNTSLYEEEVTVPLVLWSSDGRLRHPEVVQARQIDIGPTVADLFGLELDETPVQGVSLLRTPGPRPVYLSTFFDDLALGLVEHPHKYVYDPADDRLLEFDLAADPLEARPGPVEAGRKASIVARLRAFQAFQRAAFEP